MAFSHNPKIITDGLVCALDAADKNSYSGSGAGANWYDLVQGGGRTGDISTGLNFTMDNDQAATGANTGSLVNEHVKGLHFTGSADNFLVGTRTQADNLGGLNTGGSSANFTYEVWVKFNHVESSIIIG